MDFTPADRRGTPNRNDATRDPDRNHKQHRDFANVPPPLRARPLPARARPNLYTQIHVDRVNTLHLRISVTRMPSHRPPTTCPRQRRRPWRSPHDRVPCAGSARRPDELPAPVRALDRRRGRPARRRSVLREPDADHRAAVLRGGARHRRRRRAGPGRRARRRAGLGTDVAGRARRGPEPDRRPDGDERRPAGAGRVLRERQADPRDAGRRHPAGDRPPPLLRRRDPGAGGRAVGDRRRHRRVPLPRAAGRRGADHPVELPDPDGDLEARPGAGRGQRRGAQAGRADAGVGALSHEPDRRPAAAGRGEHRQRLRRGGGQAAGVQRPGGARSPSPARPPPAG